MYRIVNVFPELALALEADEVAPLAELELELELE